MTDAKLQTTAGPMFWNPLTVSWLLGVVTGMTPILGLPWGFSGVPLVAAWVYLTCNARSQWGLK